MPVIYFNSGSDSAHARVSHEMLFTLRELRSLAIALARLEAKEGIEDRDTLDAPTLDAVGYVLEGSPSSGDESMLSTAGLPAPPSTCSTPTGVPPGISWT